MAVNPSPFGPKPQFELSDGTPAIGNKLFFYVAGSVNTKQNTYTDSTGGTANTNPVVLNTLGQPTTQIWFTSGQTYKAVYAPSTDTDPPTSPIWTIDNLAGINDVTVPQSEWVAGPAPTYVSATSFTLAGDQTSTFTKSRRIKTTNSGGTIYSTITATAFGAVTTVTVANDSGTLDSGLSAVSYGLISAVNPTIDADMVHRKGAAVVSAATTDIWSIVGDYVHVTGATGPITSFGTAPYAGAQRIVIFDSTPTITHNATSLILPGSANIVAAANDRAIVRADTTANAMVVAYIKASGLPVTQSTQPTRQKFLTGSGTYTTPTNATRINVRLVGAGGSGATSGANGGDTTFSTLTGQGGRGAGTQGGPGGIGGTGTGGDINISGGAGAPGFQGAVANVLFGGGNGGNSAFGGGGGGGAPSASGTAGATNSGGGGGGDGTGSATNGRAGGGAGGYVEKLITSPAATYSYGVGAGGVAGTGGQAGADGIIIVDEWYD